MRIAAGVLLIIASILNLVAGLGYTAVGGGGAALGNAAAEAVASQAASQAAAGQKVDPELQKQNEEAAKKLGEATQGAGGLLFFGIFLVVLFGLQIAGGVVLFREKAAGFAMIVGVLSIVGEGVGAYLTAFGVMNILGLVAGLLAIIASRGYANKA
jgi:hypothetical protein